jgi:amino acid transporter
VFENILLTISAVTPASSVFIIVPVAFANYGTATFLSFIIAAGIGVVMALCWAELGATYRTAGGDYAMISRAVNGAFGFANFGLQLVLGLFIPATIALGMGTYLAVILSANAKIVGAIVIITSAIIASLNIRFGTAVVGAFLYAEMAALVVVSFLGFAHIERPFSELILPLVYNANGQAVPATLGLVMAGVATAIFSYNGYNTAVYLSEEMVGSSKGVARAVLWSLLIVVLAELIPVTAVLLGASSIPELSKAPDLTAFVTERGGAVMNTVISLAIAGSIFNAVIAIIIQLSRALYNSGREQVWPEWINRWFAAIHPKYHSPWGATLFIGLFGAIAVLVLDVYSLVTFTGAFLTVAYAMIAFAALWSRRKHPDRPRPYRMPGWPLPPILALLALVYVFTQQNPRDMAITLIVLAIFVAYYLLFIRPVEWRRHALEQDLGLLDEE